MSGWSAYVIVDGEIIQHYDFYTTSYSYRGTKPLPRIGESIKFNIPHADKTKKGHEGYLIEQYYVSVIDIIHDETKYQTQLICNIITHDDIYSKD